MNAIINNLRVERYKLISEIHLRHLGLRTVLADRLKKNEYKSSKK